MIAREEFKIFHDGNVSCRRIQRHNAVYEQQSWVAKRAKKRLYFTGTRRQLLGRQGRVQLSWDGIFSLQNSFYCCSEKKKVVGRYGTHPTFCCSCGIRLQRQREWSTLTAGMTVR